jgi:hypothetical protein
MIQRRSIHVHRWPTSAFAPIAGGWFTMGTQLGHEGERAHRVFVDRFFGHDCPTSSFERR